MKDLAEIEMSYVASVIRNPDMLDDHGVPISAIEGAFPRRVYTAVQSLYQKHRPIEITSIVAESDGSFTLAAIVQAIEEYATPNTLAIKDYAVQLRKRDQVTKIRRIGENLVSDAIPTADPELLVEYIEQSLLEIFSRRSVDTESLTEISARFAKELLTDKTNWDRGIETRIADLNRKITGFMPAEYIVIAAPPAFGKTAFAFDFCFYNALFGVNSLYCALDQSRKAMVQRLYSTLTGMDKYKLLHVDHHFNEAEQGSIADAHREIAQLRGSIFINDNASLSITDIRSLGRAYKRKHNIKMLVLDYIQQIRSVGRPENRTQEMTAISRQIKELARELEIPIIALSQLSRSYDGECSPGQNRWPRPRLTMLRDSGAIEQDASMVIFLFNKLQVLRERFGDDSKEYQLEHAKNEHGIVDAEIIVAKQKDGETGTIFCKFDKNKTRFYSGAPAGRPEPRERYIPGDGQI